MHHLASLFAEKTEPAVQGSVVHKKKHLRTVFTGKAEAEPRVGQALLQSLADAFFLTVLSEGELRVLYM